MDDADDPHANDPHANAVSVDDPREMGAGVDASRGASVAYVDDSARSHELLRQLVSPRPPLEPVDPALALELRNRLDDAAAAGICAVAPGVVVRLTKAVVRDVRTCERRLVGRLRAGAGEPTVAQIRGQLLDHGFAVIAAGHRPSGTFTDAALSAAVAAGDHELLRAWEALGPEEGAALREGVDRAGATLATDWPDLGRDAHLRVQEPLQVSLAEGRVVLTGRADVVLGYPTENGSGTTLVDVKSGTPRRSDADDALWYALLDTLRSGVASLQSGNYYLASGELALLPITADVLLRKAAEVGDAIVAMVGLAAGELATATPNGLCPSCPELDCCAEGRRFCEDRALIGLSVRVDADADDTTDTDIDSGPAPDAGDASREADLPLDVLDEGTDTDEPF